MTVEFLAKDVAWVRGGRNHDVVHDINCTRKGSKWVVWNFADGKNAERVDFIIRARPWLRWCKHCRPQVLA